MADRVSLESGRKPGVALIALAAIVVITAAWWALALWPAGAVEPAWLARTRSACFGVQHGGLPDAGGWILLIGEPVGMAAALAMVWGDALRGNLRWIRSRRRWRAAALAGALAAVGFFAALGQRVAARSASPDAPADGPVVVRRVGRPAPQRSLLDQNEQRVSLAAPDGGVTLLTFAYGHCSTVCPTVVSDLRVVRRESPRKNIRIVVLTLDPWRDTPERLPSLARHWKLQAGDRVLSGSIDEVERTLDELEIGRKRDETTGDIDHGVTAMLIDDQGRIEQRIDGGSIADLAMLLH